MNTTQSPAELFSSALVRPRVGVELAARLGTGHINGRSLQGAALAAEINAMPDIDIASLIEDMQILNMMEEQQ